MTVIIATANEADAALILALLQRCELPTGGVAENIQAFAVARSDGLVVGTSGVERYGACGLLRSVAVEPSKPRSGVAAPLVERAVLESERGGLDALYLLTTTAKAYFERRT
jgi:amino-acid N-acetyltransferase